MNMSKAQRILCLEVVGVATLTSCSLFNSTEPTGGFVGCVWQGSGLHSYELPVARPSIYPIIQDPAIATTVDRQLSAATDGIAQVYGVTGQAFYYDEDASPNSFAVPIPSDSFGTVYIGRHLVAGEITRFLATEYGKKQFTYGVTAVLAHELAHLVQFQHSIAEASVRRELEADFIAGWFFSVLSVVDPNFTSNAGYLDGVKALYDRGDYLFNQREHHGTPDERKAAFAAGYSSQAPDVSRAWVSAEQYARSIHPATQ